MRILITGVAGFIGSHLFEVLKTKHTVRGIDNYSLGTYKHRDIYPLDLVKEKQLAGEVIEAFKPDIVYHLASWAHEGLSQFMPIKITENNYNAFLNTVVPAIKSGCKRFVAFSSMSVYGERTPPFHESMEPKPTDVYAVAKTAMETTLKILADVHDFDYTIVRPHNVYGPRQNLSDPYRNVVGIFIHRVLRGLSPIIYGDGEQVRSFTYIDDVLLQLVNSGLSADARNETFNVGSIACHTINELAEIVLDTVGSKLKPIHVTDRPREVKEAFTTNDKAQILGKQKVTSLEQGVKEMIEWAKKQDIEDFKYLDGVELQSERTPRTWTEKLM